MASLRTPGIRPRPTAWSRLDAACRQCFPAASTAALLLLLAGPLDLPGQASLLSAVALGCVFFWSLRRPLSLPPPAVFLLGLLSDLLGLTPPGVSVLILLAAHGVAARWRQALEPRRFAAAWLAFVPVAGGAAILQWAAISLLSVRLMPGGAVLLQWGLTTGLYPALAALLSRAHRGFADPDGA